VTVTLRCTAENTFLLFALASTLVITAASGCGDSPPSIRITDTEVLSKSQVFDNALSSIDKMYEFESEDAGHLAVFYFNRWLDEQPTVESWEADPLVATLPDSIREALELKDIERNKVVHRDTREIRETLWLRDISRWATDITQSLDQIAQKWVDHTRETRSDNAADMLRESLCLFDWTVRNVQLVSARDAVADQVSEFPEFEGILGPGYSQLPDDSVLLGSADVWERAQVFLELLRQRKIPAAVLAFREGESLKLWACGVAIEGEVYVMDPALGLPLAIFEKGRLATLTELVASADLFRSYDVGTELRYDVEASQLDGLVALISAPPFSLTRAAAQIQQRMTGERRWALSSHASRVATEFKRHAAITEARIWDMPVRAAIYHRRLAENMAQDTDVANEYARDRFAFDQGPLSTARKLHLRGMFQKYDGGKPGALIFYRDLRQTEAAIDDLGNNRALLHLLGIRRAPFEPEEVFQSHVQFGKKVLEMSREHASYFLGLLHYDAGNFVTSANWLQKRTLDEFPSGHWQFGSAYNLARARERIGEWDRARQLLLLSESPQRHGDLLRARLIRTEVTENQAEPQAGE
jgi:hypothetical protein